MVFWISDSPPFLQNLGYPPNRVSSADTSLYFPCYCLSFGFEKDLSSPYVITPRGSFEIFYIPKFSVKGPLGEMDVSKNVVGPLFSFGLRLSREFFKGFFLFSEFDFFLPYGLRNARSFGLSLGFYYFYSSSSFEDKNRNGFLDASEQGLYKERKENLPAGKFSLRIRGASYDGAEFKESIEIAWRREEPPYPMRSWRRTMTGSLMQMMMTAVHPMAMVRGILT